MYQVKAYKYGKTYRAESLNGDLVSLCAESPVDAAKKIARELERKNRLCIVLAGDRPDRFRVEYVDFLRLNGRPVFIHNLTAH